MTHGSSSTKAKHPSVTADVDIGPFRINIDGSQGTADAQNERLAWHHEAMRLCLGGLYPCAETVRSVLVPVPGRTTRILDIGCGSRMWALEMANEFPHAEVWGWDRPRVREIWTGTVPPNCRFETAADYNFLENYKEEFDLIHMRFVAGGCTNFSKTMEDIQTCLRPGGLFILIDSTGDLLREDGVTLFPMKSSQDPEGIRLRRLFYEIRHANIQMGFHENAMHSTLEEGMWGPDFSRLSDCGAAEVLVPIGAWAEAEDVEEEQLLKVAGEQMRKSLNMIRMGHEIVLRMLGFNRRTLDAWVTEVDAELQNDTLRMLLDVRVLWGRRSSQGASASHLPRAVQFLRRAEQHYQPAESSSLSRNAPTQMQKLHRFIRIFSTKTEWQKVTKERRHPNSSASHPIPFVHRPQLQTRRSHSRGFS